MKLYTFELKRIQHFFTRITTITFPVKSSQKAHDFGKRKKWTMVVVTINLLSVLKIKQVRRSKNQIQYTFLSPFQNLSFGNFFYMRLKAFIDFQYEVVAINHFNT